MQLVFLLAPAVLLLVVPASAGVCPGGKVKCPDNMTCCPLANHEYGCCIYPEAQCCHDHVHCCPHGMKCDAKHQACLKNGFPVLFFTQASVKPEVVEEVNPTDFLQHNFMDTNHIDETGVEDESESITCPDGHVCPSSFTCCKMYRGHYGCCPYSKAQCCRDGFHCCPHNSQCNPVTGGCEREGGVWLGKAAFLRKSSEVTKPNIPEVAGRKDPGGKCPDGHPCEEKYTCCHVVGGGYGCCSLTDAVCCTDLIHCCPQNTNCNTTTGTCDKKSGSSVPAFSLATRKFANMPDFSEDQSVLESEDSKGDVNDICPDKKTKCYPGNTCCQMNNGSYGCCPFAEATCCTDHETCCPSGYQCAAAGLCERMSSLSALPFLPPVSQQGKPRAPPSDEQHRIEDESMRCPDGSMCPDGNTCCSISASRYGCCPMPMATCCGDMQHCCPHGYWCADSGCERLEGGMLNKTLIVHRTLNVESPKGKPKALPSDEQHRVEDEFISCPDGSMCPDRNTCCRISASRYGCCPMPMATCCGDMQHCCPHGYWCADSGCQRLEGGMLNKTLIVHRTLNVESPNVRLAP